MPNYDKQERSEYSTSEQACTRCRERKIKCGRERPQCSNCERDDTITCIYQNPTKRINHLKSLFESVSGVQDRLSTIESHLNRLTVNIAREESSSTSFPRQTSAIGAQRGEEDDESSLECSLSSEGHSIHETAAEDSKKVLSLFDLCNDFRSHTVASNFPKCTPQLENALQALCDTAGAVEPFPAFGDQSLVSLLPKQQAIAAIGHFFQHLDCTTDIFVQSNLLANLERVYSQPLEPDFDVWAVSFKVITLLVLGMEISSQKTRALFGDFARSFLPSRATLVNSRLLTTPKLINVQTLILLVGMAWSVAAQQFDPPGWSEIIFTYACMLARTMGIQHAQLFPRDTSAIDNLERAKVLRSLYSRDKSLCITRGSVSWFPSYDCKIVPQLRAAAGESQAPYSARYQLAMVQEDVYRFTHGIFETGRPSKSDLSTVQNIEQRLNQCIHNFGGLANQAAYYSPAYRAIIPLEFLATRIIALQHSSEQHHIGQTLWDAKVSCLLFIIAAGSQDVQFTDAFNELMSDSAFSPRALERKFPAANTNTIPFASVLDAFSVPAFFILLKSIVHSIPEASTSDSDLEILRKVSSCYSSSTERTHYNSYHRKLALVFDQLLTIVDLLRDPQKIHPTSKSPSTLPAPVAQMSHSSHVLPTQPDMLEFFHMSAAPKESFSNFSLPTPPSIDTVFSWDWPGAPSLLGVDTTIIPSSTNPSEHGDSDLLSQILLGSPQIFSDISNGSKTWPIMAQEGATPRKRQRTAEVLEENSMQTIMSETLIANDAEISCDF